MLLKQLFSRAERKSWRQAHKRLAKLQHRRGFRLTLAGLKVTWEVAQHAGLDPEDLQVGGGKEVLAVLPYIWCAGQLTVLVSCVLSGAIFCKEEGMQQGGGGGGTKHPGS